MTLSSSALITVADCKTFLGISGTDDDTVLELLVNAASKKAIQICGRELVTVARTYYTESPRAGSRILQLRTWPVSTDPAIVIYQDTDYAWGAATLVAATAYSLHAATGAVTLIDSGTTWYTASKSIKITYTAGVGTIVGTDIPDDLKLAVSMLVGWYMQRRNTPGLKSVRGAVVELEFSGTMGPGGIPVDIIGAFDPYKRRL